MCKKDKQTIIELRSEDGISLASGDVMPLNNIWNTATSSVCKASIVAIIDVNGSILKESVFVIGLINSSFNPKSAIAMSCSVEKPKSLISISLRIEFGK